MKRFRINGFDEIIIAIRHKGEHIRHPLFDTGFTSVDEAIKYAKNSLDYNYKGLGRKIEIMIYNKTKDLIKYYDTFS